jgi:hypothetical protein
MSFKVTETGLSRRGIGFSVLSIGIAIRLRQHSYAKVLEYQIF